MMVQCSKPECQTTTGCKCQNVYIDATSWSKSAVSETITPTLILRIVREMRRTNAGWERDDTLQQQYHGTERGLFWQNVEVVMKEGNNDVSRRS